MADTNFDSVVATTFTGALVGNVTGNVTGNLTGNVTGSVSGGTTASLSPQLIAAAGATQGAATAITKALAIITTCTASARGIKLSAAATGALIYVMSLCTQGVKVYPASGDKIGTAATNAAVVQTGLKGALYAARDATQWAVLRGA